jgi:lipoprotein-anchoring transpeptidase ErfK/SrfK
MVHVALLLSFALGVAQTPPPPVPVGTDPTKAYIKPSVAKAIVIELATQTLIAYEGSEEKYRFRCSTGKNNGTPRGEWPIRQKLRYNRALPEYGSVPIPFSLRLDIVRSGRRYRIAIHAHKSVPSYPASHGCIRLSHADAETLFGWADVGVVVTIR